MSFNFLLGHVRSISFVMIEKYKRNDVSSITVQRLLSFKQKLKEQKVRDIVEEKKLNKRFKL
jgi:hypothetical protein